MWPQICLMLANLSDQGYNDCLAEESSSTTEEDRFKKFVKDLPNIEGNSNSDEGQEKQNLMDTDADATALRDAVYGTLIQ